LTFTLRAFKAAVHSKCWYKCCSLQLLQHSISFYNSSSFKKTTTTWRTSIL